MATIAANSDVVTLINVFTVDAENQQRLVTLLVDATQAVMKNLPGFVSANIHKSADGVRVANYAQWRTRGDFEAMLKNPKAQEHMKPIMEMARADAHLYAVVDTTSV